MTNKPILTEFDKWKGKGTLSLYDYIFHSMEEVNTDIYFAFLELFWPTFILYKGCVFIKEKFSEEYFEQLVKQSENIEYWMNLLTVDPYFDNDDNGKLKAESLAKSLVEIWQAKLKIDFPSQDFTVKYLYDSEYGDYGLTFYSGSKN